jgi:hypothetical protein
MNDIDKIRIKKSDIIPIIQNNINRNYELKYNNIDPSESSPPNDFIIKLNMRIFNQTSFNNLESLINK